MSSSIRLVTSAPSRRPANTVKRAVRADKGVSRPHRSWICDHILGTAPLTVPSNRRFAANYADHAIRMNFMRALAITATFTSLLLLAACGTSEPDRAQGGAATGAATGAAIGIIGGPIGIVVGG